MSEQSSTPPAEQPLTPLEIQLLLILRASHLVLDDALLVPEKIPFIVQEICNQFIKMHAEHIADQGLIKAQSLKLAR